MTKSITNDVVRKLRNGDHAAFEAIFVAYFSKVKYFIRGFIKSEDDAEELAQEIFVKIWTNREQLDLERSFNAYVYVMARNSVYNHLKAKLVRENYSRQHVSWSESVNEGEELIVREEIHLLEQTVVDKMPERRKKIYILSRHSGFKNEEIARELLVSKKTVENQLSLAIKELKKVLKIIIFCCLWI